MLGVSLSSFLSKLRWPSYSARTKAFLFHDVYDSLLLHASDSSRHLSFPIVHLSHANVIVVQSPDNAMAMLSAFGS